MTIEKFPRHFASGNGTRRNQQNALAGNPKDRIQNLKYAIFYLVAAIILFLAIEFQLTRREMETSLSRLRTSV
jgi:hypothetical protein